MKSTDDPKLRGVENTSESTTVAQMQLEKLKMWSKSGLMQLEKYKLANLAKKVPNVQETGTLLLVNFKLPMSLFTQQAFMEGLPCP